MSPREFPREFRHSSRSVSQIQITGDGSVSMQSGGNLGSVRIVNGRVWIDGEEITEKKVKPQDVPPTAPPGTLSVQKSHRPRELWGDLMAKFVLTVEIDDDHLTENRMGRVAWAIGCAADEITDTKSFGDTWDGNSPPHYGGTSLVTGSWYLQEF